MPSIWGRFALFTCFLLGGSAVCYNELNDKGDHHATHPIPPAPPRTLPDTAAGRAGRIGTGPAGGRRNRLSQQQQSAQQSNKNEAPPKLERVEPGSDVPATSHPLAQPHPDQGNARRRPGHRGRSQQQRQPLLHEAEHPPGNAVPGSASGNSIRAPQWKVGEFDLSGKRKAANETGTNTPAPADVPPPPPLPAGTADKK
jgi:hypothetical protein